MSILYAANIKVYITFTNILFENWAQWIFNEDTEVSKNLFQMYNTYNDLHNTQYNISMYLWKSVTPITRHV